MRYPPTPDPVFRNDPSKRAEKMKSMNNLPQDMKNYRAGDGCNLYIVIISMACLLGLLMLLGWIGEQHHQERIHQIKSASHHQCT